MPSLMAKPDANRSLGALEPMKPRQVWQCRNGRCVEIISAIGAFITVRYDDNGKLSNRFYDGTSCMVWTPCGEDLMYFLYDRTRR